MFMLDGQLCWSASDLTQAADCEFALLRGLDVKLGRGERSAPAADPLLDQIARMGDAHEARILAELQESPSTVAMIERASTRSAAELRALHALTIETLAERPDVLYQGGFFDGEFHGYADFLLRSDEGWVVCDAKLARQARPKALLQLAAYADQIARAGLPVAPHAVLLLGNGQREEFPVCDLMPIFRERRRRLRAVLAERCASADPVRWASEEYTACGGCTECSAAAEATNDLILVAGMRMDQRRKLRAAGIETVADLAVSTQAPPGMSVETFAKLRGQAALQWEQMQDESAPVQVRYELLESAAATLGRLPTPSEGDLFFDFEGDPLHNEGDLSRWGLEYLWGTMDALPQDETHDPFTPLWAHDSAGEREALVAFLDRVLATQAQHPKMHVYHYAPYETTALKRLVSTYQTHEAELDSLLRAGVFVDLYATVRGTVRVSQPSYSIKKLEPLYMGDELRTSSVQAGDQSIAWYHEYRELAESGDLDAADERLRALLDYNRYDCRSTLRLRDWLLEMKAGVPTPAAQESEVPAGAPAEEDLLVDALRSRVAETARRERTPDQQAYAMLAASLGYYSREHRPFWWEHFDRLARPLEEWAEDRDVFRVTGHEVLSGWALEGRARNPRREVRLTGDWAPGSTPGDTACVIYEEPLPPGAQLPTRALYGYRTGQPVRIDDDENVRYVESCKPDLVHDAFPIALAPASPPPTKAIEAAIRQLAAAASAAAQLPSGAGLDLLRRLPPQLRGGAALPTTGDTIEDIVASLVGMDCSYLAVQGPPGTGKTYTGSRVIRALVERHGWRVGVVAQSHAVVENMLDALVRAGLDPGLIGKSDPRRQSPSWTVVPNTGNDRAAHLTKHTDTGCVLGGTAWTFSSDKLVEAGGFDLLVVDEAGQFALAPTLGVSLVAERLLLLGDPQQLPQVTQGTHPEPVDRSALAWLLGDHDTLPAAHGYFLGASYRMHPAVCSAVSSLSYEGRLSAAESAAMRSLDGVPPGLAVVEVDHRENRTESPEEAEAVVRTVADLIGRMWSDPEDTAGPRPLDERDFLVVAPYNAQVNLIRRTLAAAGLAQVRVGTVDKFQGQEAPVAIVSMTASSPGDVPRGMGFLINRNRVNVAVSRAQWRAVIVRSSALTSYMPGTVGELLDLGSFIGLCERGA